ncbi:MAG: phosphatase PAP2 family protein [Solirubrobacteraceae bacterium]|nr:phosphatase PAP2 family protein [Solirubrobacteraceae bacterium]
MGTPDHDPGRRALLVPLVAAAVALAGFVAVVVWAQVADAFPGDRRSLEWIADPRWDSPRVGPMLRLMDLAADPGVAVISIAIAMSAWSRAGRREACAVLAGACSVLVSGALKAIIGPTPFAVQHAVLNGDPSLPSGHVVWAVAFYGTIGWMGWRRGWWELALACAAVVVAMGPARALAGVHLVSDVVAGYLFGIAWAVLVIAWWERGRSLSGRRAPRPGATARPGRR